MASLAALLLALVCANAVATASETEVAIVGLNYQPTPMTVQVGDTVTWSNQSFLAHTVTAVDGSFDSDRMAHGSSFSFTFNTPGTYKYMCSLHPGMRGEVVVQGATSSTPGPPAMPGPNATPGMVSLSLSHAAGEHARRVLIGVLGPRPGAKALLEIYSREHFSWRQVAHGTLNASGRLTLSLREGLHRLVRVVLVGKPGEPAAISRAVRI